MAITLSDYCDGDQPHLGRFYLPLALIYALQKNRQDVVRSLVQRPGDPDPILHWFYTDNELGNRGTIIVPNFAVLKQGARYCIVVRGTQYAEHWRGHLQGSFGKPDYDLPGNALVHAFFHGAEQFIYNFVRPLLPADHTTIERVYITGHSFGGAVAHLLGNRFAEKNAGLRVQVCTFGEPRALLGVYSGAKPECHVRVNRLGDLVGQLPFGSVTVVDVAGPFSRLVSWASRGAKIGQKISDTIEWYGPRAWRHSGRLVTAFRDKPMEVAGFLEDYIGNPLSVVMNPGWRFGHIIGEGYRPSLKAHWQQTGRQPEQAEAVAALDTLYNDADPPAPPPPAPPVTPADQQAINRGLGFAPGTGPTTEQLLAATSVTLVAEVVAVSPGANVGFFSGVGSMPYYKLTYRIDFTEHSKSEGYVFLAPDLDAARTKALAMIKVRAACLGNNTDNTELIGGIPLPGTPIIRQGRITDPLNPRKGIPLKVPRSDGVGWAKLPGGNSGSGPPFKTISVTAQGSILVGGQTYTRNRTISFIGQPDAVIQNEDYYGPQVNANLGLTWHQAARNFLMHITEPLNTWGFMGVSPVIPKLDVFDWRVDTSGRVFAKIPDHDYAAGDRVRISSADKGGINGTYVVTLGTTPEVMFNGLLRAAGELPEYAKAQLVQRSNGERQMVFFALQRPSTTTPWSESAWFVPANRTPGNRVSLGSLRKRKKRRGR